MTTLRMAVVALLAIGASIGVSDRAAASSALSDTTSATAAQYSQCASPTPSDGQSSRSRPRSTNPPPAQPTVCGSDLPLTGYAAVTLLLLAVAFLIGGLLLRRGTRDA